ncbi:archaellin/type IV pilin N-terminal domain-containing protein [Methanoregula sp.]|uniref:archaellin/type IV pilin N-terminal domain-containing protein n=1 Tax=Methanoregula sp. TaxID=2052170 RepID=UPI003BB0C543
MSFHEMLEEAFTGLEAAIVLIAFIVVAAVFSYVVLGAGFFTSQTAQATVHTAVGQASSVLEVSGVYGIRDATNNNLDYVNVTFGSGGVPGSDTVISYDDNNGGRIGNLTYGDCPTNQANSPTWCIANDSGANVVMVGVPSTATPNTKFNINFQPSTGVAVPITGTVPGSLTPVVVLD